MTSSSQLLNFQIKLHEHDVHERLQTSITGRSGTAKIASKTVGTRPSPADHRFDAAVIGTAAAL